MVLVLVLGRRGRGALGGTLPIIINSLSECGGGRVSFSFGLMLRLRLWEVQLLRCC